MEATIIEPVSVASQSYAQSFFKQDPTDSRFINRQISKFMPSTNLDADTITFSLSRFEAPNVYEISEAVLETRISITKSDGSLPDTAKNVGVVNNVGHSMWEAVRLTINDVEVTGTSGAYPFKAYIVNALSYDTWVKSNQLSTCGWYGDTSGHMNGESSNDGFVQRCNLFRQDFEQTQPYRKDGANFFTRLHHDLAACEQGLPPGTKIRIDLDRCKDDFLILKESTDDTKYKIKLLFIALYMPIAALSQSVSTEINSILTKEKPISISFRNIDIRPHTIPKNTIHFYSELLFSEDVPCRLVVCFVQSAAKKGDQTLNPFNFQRRWTVPKLSTALTHSVDDQRDDSLSERLRHVEDTNKRLLETNQQLLNSLKILSDKFSSFGPKGKGKGKKSKVQQSASPETNQSPIASTSQIPQEDEDRFARIPSDLWTEDNERKSIFISISCPLSLLDLPAVAIR